MYNYCYMYIIHAYCIILYLYRRYLEAKHRGSLIQQPCDQKLCPSCGLRWSRWIRSLWCDQHYSSAFFCYTSVGCTFGQKVFLCFSDFVKLLFRKFLNTQLWPTFCCCQYCRHICSKCFKSCRKTHSPMPITVKLVRHAFTCCLSQREFRFFQHASCFMILGFMNTQANPPAL